ncbi:MAG: hypothetical protein E6719_02135, partial [Dermabacter sp.]|nr:hypothetical protein [Dermabacter sp.]
MNSTPQQAHDPGTENISGDTGENVPAESETDFASLIEPSLAPFIADTRRRLDAERRRLIAERAQAEKVHAFAFEKLQAASEDMAKIVEELLTLGVFSIDDVQAFLKGTAQGVYL